MAVSGEDLPSFSSIQDELKHWKTEAIRYRDITGEIQQELHEFRECSEDIERELEAQLEQNEKQTKELKQQNTSLTFECETLKERYEKQQAESFKQISELQTEIAKFTVTNAELTKDVRELEQRNDDLERTNRVIIVSLDDFEQRLNQALERNAFLESELDEKDSLAITVQRLRDEARDLHHELNVRQHHKLVDHTKPVEVEHKTTSSKPRESTTAKTPQTPVGKKLFTNGTVSNSSPTTFQLPETPKINHKHESTILCNGVDKIPLTPSARVSALNIVGDLLRKVGALESKLASCRSFVHEQPAWHGRQSLNLSWTSESDQSGKVERANRRSTTTKIKV